MRSLQKMDYAEARAEMVKRQLRGRNIRSERVLTVMGDIPRELFIPENRRSESYEDHPIPIGMDQTISQPYMVATMTEKLDPMPHERILEIGTGSGYQTAVLARMARFVYSVERIESLAHRAEDALNELGIENVKVFVGDGSVGLIEEAPFDGILVAAGSPQVPTSLKQQLSEGGRLVIPVGDRYGQCLKIVTRTPQGFRETDDCGCVFVPLIGKEGW